MLQIVSCLERWQFIGRVHREGDLVIIEEARNIRQWGTTEGLGELAIKGPQPNTKLDFYGRQSVPVLAVIGYTDCDTEVWKKLYP